MEPQSIDIRIRECDDLVFVLTITGNYTEPYLVEVSCVSPGAGGGKPALAVSVHSVTWDLKTLASLSVFVVYLNACTCLLGVQLFLFPNLFLLLQVKLPTLLVVIQQIL